MAGKKWTKFSDAKTSREKMRAYYIRKKLKAGKPLTEKQKAWLKQYEGQTGLSYRATESHTPSPQPDAENATQSETPETLSDEKPSYEPTTEEPVAPDSTETPPPIDVVVPPSTDTPPPSVGQPSPYSDSSQSSASSHFSRSQSPDEKRKLAEAAADFYCNIIMGISAELKAEGMFHVPDVWTKKIVHPATVRFAIRHLPDDMVEDDFDAAVVLGSGAVTAVQGIRMKRRRATVKEPFKYDDEKPATPPKEAETNGRKKEAPAKPTVTESVVGSGYKYF